MYRQIEINLTPEEVIDYSRKSQSDDPLLTVEEVLAKHEALLDEWAEKHLGGKVPEKNKYREVVSGETIKKRPEIQTVLRRIESPKIKAIKVVEPQRLTRGDLEDIGRLMKLIKHTNTLVITLSRIYDLRDEYDWDAFERELKRGNEYLEYTKKILNRGKLLSVSQGNYISSIPPYGFDKTFIMDGKRKCPTLKENKEQADIVRLIFDLYVNKGLGFRKICNHLEGLKIKPPKNEHWSPNALQNTISNVHYIGKVRWNWRKTVTIVSESEFVKTRPVSQIGEYLIYEGKHDGIVPIDLYEAAQEMRGKNPRVTGKADIRNPLVGLIYCRCGRAMIMQTYQKGKTRERLVCPEQARCGVGSCAFDEIIDRVCLILKECIEDFEVRIENNEGDSVKLHANLIKNLENKMAELQEKEIAQWEKQAHPDESQRMPQHIFKVLNERLLKEKEEVQAALCKAYESMPEPVDYEEKVVSFQDALEALKNSSIDVRKKNMLLKRCIERIVYSRERPQRIKGKGTKGSPWTNPPIELKAFLKV